MKPLRLIPSSDVPNWAIIPTLSKPTQKIPTRYPIETNIAKTRNVIREVTKSDNDPQMLNSIKKKSGSNRNSAISFLEIISHEMISEKNDIGQYLIIFIFLILTKGIVYFFFEEIAINNIASTIYSSVIITGLESCIGQLRLVGRLNINYNCETQFMSLKRCGIRIAVIINPLP